MQRHQKKQRPNQNTRKAKVKKVKHSDPYFGQKLALALRRKAAEARIQEEVVKNETTT